ncbi:MAG: hypothetical protein KGI33_05165 [Thaumarchaeota archaeon]|nr:hypothetical protein [Nitrososphaerota archaeon]
MGELENYLSEGKEGKDESEVTLEEMWRVIEDFGIDRKLYEMKNPTISEIKSLYHLIKGRRA